ncbi:MAG: semialdehyde dehydrogenase [Verrucomicrobia bacterium]|nr:semialdehyde dehydrogenase [Verrucomicrobiota bacterium]
MTNPPLTIALLGAGGKMGCRITDHLKDRADYTVLCVETGERGLANLHERGLAPVPRDAALARADVVILALPDRILGAIAREAVPLVRPGTIVMLLDPAAAHAGELPARADVTYFASHPCHPSVFEQFSTKEEIDDFFGGTHARQAIVCSLIQGPEAHFALGERVARDIYAPVTRSHRITLEQMALLEPTMAETIAIGLTITMREALEEAVHRGVPRAAAEDFMFGHIKVALGIAFGRVNFPFSDGCTLIARYGRGRMLQADWRTLFDPASVRAQTKAIVSGRAPDADSP